MPSARYLKSLLTAHCYRFWRAVFFVALLSLSGAVSGQVGGEGVFAFLDLPVTPRVAGLGGKVASCQELNTSGMGAYNPSLITPAMHGQLEVGSSLFYGGMAYSHTSFFYQLNRGGIVGGSMRGIWYGRMTRRGELGEAQGTFSAYDLAFSAHWAYSLGDHFRVGVSLTPIYSQLESYWALGLILDAGVSYVSSSGLFNASLLLKNFGGSVRPYSRGNHEWAPVELLIGCSYTLENAPLRFFLTIQNLNRWNTRYMYHAHYTGNEGDMHPAKEKVWPEHHHQAEVAAHPIVGLEIIPSRFFFLQIAYNYSRRQQLGIAGQFWFEGFSYGLGLNVGRFTLHYSRAHYHRAGGTNHLAIAWQFISLQRGGVRLPQGF